MPMLYDNYVEKMKKIISGIKLMYRFRVLIICLSVLCMGLAGAFTATKGMIQDVTTPPLELSYGDELSAEASALFSKATIQYKLASASEWTEEKPVDAGTYMMRAVSKGMFGNRYSDIYTFTIAKKPLIISVETGKLVYGNTPNYSTDSEDGTSGLIPGDSISTISFIYNTFNIGNQTVTPDQAKIVIVNEKNEDVTNNYDITVQSTTVEITQRPVSITPVSIEKVYDGTSFNYNGEVSFTNNSLVEGHKVEVNVQYKDQTGNMVSEPINAGTYTADIQSYNVFNGTENVTANYAFSLSSSKFKILKRDITIETNSQTKIYDGIALTSKSVGYALSADSKYELVEGHYIEVVDDSLSITEVGTITNEIKVIIKDQSGNDVTNNYNITYKYGKLEVLSNELKISTASISKVYDGTPLIAIEQSMDGYYLSEGQLAPDHTMYAFNTPSITDVGSISNSIIVKIQDYFGRDVTDNYNISYSYGTLEVTKRSITVQTATISKVYDGLELITNDPNAGGFMITNGLLAVGDEMFAVDAPSITNVGTIKNEFNIVIRNSNNFIVTDNYSIEYIYGTLEVSVREITIDTASVSKVYDGTPLSAYSDSDYWISENSENELVSFHTMYVDTKTVDSITYVGSTINNFVVCIEDGINNVDGNYKINYNYGTLTIDYFVGTVVTGSDSKVYDGELLANGSCYLSEGELPYGHKFKGVGANPYIINAGEIENIFEVIVHNENEEDVSSNFILTYDYGTLTVVKRPVTIKARENEVTYGLDINLETQGYYLYDNGSINESTSLIDNSPLNLTYSIYNMDETLAAKNFADFYNAGTYYIHIDSYNSQLDDNYDITLDQTASLTINKRVVEITPESYSVTYGDDYTYDGSKFSVLDELGLREFVDGTEVSIEVYYGLNTDASIPLSVGDYMITVYRVLTTDPTLQDEFDNNYIYNTNTNAFLTINRFSLSVSLSNELEKVYDGTAFDIAGYDYFTTNPTLLPYGEELDVNVTYRDINNNQVMPVNAGVYSVIASTYSITGGNADTNNYIITANPGKLEISRRQVSVDLLDAEKIYDGEAYVYENTIGNYEYSIDTLYELIPGVDISIDVEYYLSGRIAPPRNANTYDVITLTKNLVVVKL